MSSTKLMVTRLLIGCEIFNPISETAERNSTTPERKQDLHVLYLAFMQANCNTRWPSGICLAVVF